MPPRDPRPTTSWESCWAFPAERTLKQIPWRDAARVDAAILRFAATGEGHVRRLRSDDAVTLRLYVLPYGVRITLDRFDGLLTVWSVYPL